MKLNTHRFVMVEEVSSSGEVNFPSGSPGGQTQSLEPELQTLSNQILGPPHGQLSTNQLQESINF